MMSVEQARELLYQELIRVSEVAHDMRGEYYIPVKREYYFIPPVSFSKEPERPLNKAIYYSELRGVLAEASQLLREGVVRTIDGILPLSQSLKDDIALWLAEKYCRRG